MNGTSPRQVLYGLVAAGFVVVTAVLTLGAAITRLVPVWWSITLGAGLVLVSLYLAFGWRKTGVALSLAIGLFVAWLIGTLVLAPR